MDVSSGEFLDRVPYARASATGRRRSWSSRASRTPCSAVGKATRAFDGRDLLGDIRAPTFVFGGTADPSSPEETLRSTADAIEDADLTLVHDARHAAFHEQKPAFDSRVRSFLERPTAAPDPG